MEKCLVIGAAMLDLVIQVERLPKAGEDAYAHSQEMTVGGCAYNVADILKHFKIPYTLFAPVGNGMYAGFVTEKLRENGHQSMIHSDKCDNGYCLCLVEANGERTFLTLPGIECRFEPEWFQQLNMREYGAVYVCGYEIEGEGGEAILDFLERNRNVTLYYAPGPRIGYISKEKQQRMMALHPILHLNEKESIDYTGAKDYVRAAEQLYRETQNVVIITLGAGGAYVRQETGKVIDTDRVKAIDTNGAGDSHIATVIAMRQKGADIAAAVATANRISSLVVSVQGSTLTEAEFKNGGIV